MIFFLNKGYTGFIHAKFPRDHGQFSTEAIFDNLKWHYLCIAAKERELGGLLLEMEDERRNCLKSPLNHRAQD